MAANAELHDELRKANTALRASLDFPEEYMEPAYRHGVALYEHGRFAEAEQIFTFLAACDVANPTLWKALGSAQKMVGKHDEAVASFGLAVAAGANDPWIPVHAAECLMHQQRFSEALDALEHATLASTVAAADGPQLRSRVGALLQGVQSAAAVA